MTLLRELINIYRLNNRGLNIDPCGTPIVHFMLLDSASQTLTLLHKYEDIHASALDEKLNLESFKTKTS